VTQHDAGARLAGAQVAGQEQVAGEPDSLAEEADRSAWHDAPPLLICAAGARCGTVFAGAARDKEQPMATIPDEYLDLLQQQKKAFAHLATLMPDGTPQVTPVWFDYTGGVIRVNSAKGRTKTRNMKEGAPVALSIMDPDNAYRYLQIRGKVARVTEEGASAQIDSLAKKYLGQDKYPWSRPGEVRVTFEITPSAVQVMG
jgi:PPOX class probable F420-dependent enzyme